jgi:hypothetical protein
MKEDFFATSRNGHMLKDTFNKEDNSLDIRSNGLYPSNVLSNLTRKTFVFDGIQCESLEGFLQSLKTNDPEEQKRICMLYGGSAKKQSSKHSDWTKEQILYWNGQKIKRDSKEYYELLYSAFKECYLQNDIFRSALNSTKNIKLTHKDGKSDPKTTILTADEFITILTSIRNMHQ